MGVFKRIEYQQSTKKAIKKYESVFGEDTFPSYYFLAEYRSDKVEEKIIEAVTECLSENKDVYEMGIVPLSALEVCY